MNLVNECYSIRDINQFKNIMKIKGYIDFKKNKQKYNKLAHKLCFDNLHIVMSNYIENIYI
jgi:hypothetical protein